MSLVEYAQQSDHARVALISLRALAPSVSRSLVFHFEDVVAEIDAVDIVAPSKSRADQVWHTRLRKVSNRLNLPSVRWPLDRTPLLDKKYELVLVACENVRDLEHLGPLRPWLERSRRSVCYLTDMWRYQLPGKRSLVAASLRSFDQVMLTGYGTVEALADRLEHPVYYLPPVVDSLFFWPGRTPPTRSIDIYNMGRRSEDTHRATKALASERNLFYLHDSRGNGPVDYRDQRRLLAEFLKRTKYFVAYPGKINKPKEIMGQEEIGARYFEGAAGGAVLIGQAPQMPMFAEYFGYDGAVIDLPFGSTDVGSVYDALESQPDRVAQIRRSNVVQSLTKHDWAYHWKGVLERLGMEPMPQLEARIDRLRAAAAAIAPSDMAGAASPRQGQL